MQRNVRKAFLSIKLGRWEMFPNIVSVIFTVFTSVFLMFPPYRPVTAVNMNYAPVVLGGVILFSIGFWFYKGRKVYDGPLVEIVGRVASNVA